MSLTRLIYSSVPFGFDEPTLAAILMDARKCNARDDITGALICRADVYLQLLEGPEAAVTAALARIRRDDRHAELVLRLEDRPDARLFGAWAMLHDPAQSWAWDQAQVADGALDRAAPQDFLAVFEGLAARQGTGDPA